MPTLDAANISFNLLKIVGGDGITVGPDPARRGAAGAHPHADGDGAPHRQHDRARGGRRAGAGEAVDGALVVIDRFHHLFIRPADFERSLAFYRDTLGWSVTETWGGDGEARGAILSGGGMKVVIAERPRPRTATAPRARRAPRHPRHRRALQARCPRATHVVTTPRAHALGHALVRGARSRRQPDRLRGSARVAEILRSTLAPLRGASPRLPRALPEPATIGVCALSGRVDEAEPRARRRLPAGPRATASSCPEETLHAWRYFAGTDDERLEGFHDAGGRSRRSTSSSPRAAATGSRASCIASTGTASRRAARRSWASATSPRSTWRPTPARTSSPSTGRCSPSTSATASPTTSRSSTSG